MIDVEKCFGLHEIQNENHIIRAQVAVQCSGLCLCAHFVAIFNQQSRIGRMGWKCRQIWWDTDRHFWKRRFKEKGGLLGCGCALPPIIPEQRASCLAGCKEGGGSPGLAVQGCGRDGTHCCCCCSLLCAAVRAQPLLLQARSAAAALRRCCLLATAGGSGDCGGAVSLLASVNILFLEVELLRFCRKARALLAVMMTQS